MKTSLILSLAAAPGALPLCASADALPPAAQALSQRGVSVVGPFTSRTGLKAYGALADGQPAALYVTANGAVIAGTALDARGQALDKDALQAALSKPLPESVWRQLEASCWIADGTAGERQVDVEPGPAGHARAGVAGCQRRHSKARRGAGGQPGRHLRPALRRRRHACAHTGTKTAQNT